MIQDTCAQDSAIICHATLGLAEQAVCRGFFARHAGDTAPLRLAAMLGSLDEIPPPPEWAPISGGSGGDTAAGDHRPRMTPATRRRGVAGQQRRPTVANRPQQQRPWRGRTSGCAASQTL